MTAASLVVNACAQETRVALLEDQVVVEIYVERSCERGVAGNIYRGRVVRVLPGIQAAFVDVGLERTGFLYVSDAHLRSNDEADAASAAHRAGGPGLFESEGRPNGGEEGRTRGFREAPAADIRDVVSEGEELLVQVQKEPFGTKGARLTRHVNIPGRNLVYMPYARHIGVSRRISNEGERERLRAVLMGLREGGDGFIARTVAEGLPEQVIMREAALLKQLWADILGRGSSGPTPRLVLADLDLALRATRDLFSDHVVHVVVDCEEGFRRIREFVRSFAPGEETRVKLHTDSTPIFDKFGIEVELERALDRKVWLKCGGYVVIDQAEALTAIDVNSGKFVGKSSLEETITQINLEAVKEIAYQLRLRNIGGIIIVDFIDMAEEANREKVLTALESALSRDRAKSTIVRMSEIGLVEMTRKRVRESLGELLTEPCPYCQGRGFVKSQQSVAKQILRAVARQLARVSAARVLVNVHPEIADFLYEEEAAEVARLEAAHQTEIVPVARRGFHREHYEVVASPASP